MTEQGRGSSKQSQNTKLYLDSSIVVELFSLIHSEGLWSLLTNESKKFGEKIYKEITGSDLSTPPGAMRFSIDQHMEIISNIIPGYNQQTNFWKLVVEITWMMIAMERNPLIAQELRDAKDSENIADILGNSRVKKE